MSRRRICGAIFVGAALVRLTYLACATPLFTTLYWDLAGNLLDHGRLGFSGERSTAYEPLYPLFLAGARAITLDHARLVQAAQALLDSAGAVYLYLLAETLTQRPAVAMLAGILYAIDPTIVRHAVSPGEFSLSSTLLIIFAHSFVTAAGPGRAVVAGMWLGLVMLTRTMVLPLVPLAAALLALDRRYLAAAALAATAVAVVSPLAMRNYSVNGALLPTRSGVNLFIGNSEYSALLLPDQSPDVLQDYAMDVARQHGLAVADFDVADDRAADRLFTRLTIDEWRRRPAQMLWLKVRNLAYFFWPTLIPKYILTEATTVRFDPAGRVLIDQSAPRPAIEHVVYTTSYCLGVAAALLGIRRRGRLVRRDLILWCIVATFVAASVVYFPATRYRVPATFVLLFYAAVGLASLIPRRYGRTTAMVEGLEAPAPGSFG